jgi:glutathione S-transferase
MKLYDCTTAPSPRRVRIFLAEKGISVPTVQVDLRKGEQFSSAFRTINPECTVPVLRLDDGTTIADILGICRYFEELYPDPPLMGRTAEQKAVIEACQRRIERDGFYAAMEAFRNSTPGLKDRALPGPSHTRKSPRWPNAGVCAFSISLRGSMHVRRMNSSAVRTLLSPTLPGWSLSISALGRSSNRRSN